MLQPASRRETTWTLEEMKDKETVAKLFYDTLGEIKDKETVAKLFYYTLGEIKDKETVAKLFYDTLREIKDKVKFSYASRRGTTWTLEEIKEKGNIFMINFLTSLIPYFLTSLLP